MIFGKVSRFKGSICFILGIIFSCILAGIVGLIAELLDFGASDELSGPVAHIRVLERGIPLSPKAKETKYYYSEFYSQYIEYFSFYDSLGSLAAIKASFKNKGILDTDFAMARESRNEMVNQGPGDEVQRRLPGLWDIQQVSSEALSAEGAHIYVLLDPKQGKVYIATWGRYELSNEFSLGVPRLSKNMAEFMYNCLLGP